MPASVLTLEATKTHMDLKDIKDYLQQVDAGDYKILGIGLVLLLIPVFFLYMMISGNEKQTMGHDRMRTLKNRKAVFKLPPTAATPGASTRVKFDPDTTSTGVLIETEFNDAISRIIDNPPPRPPNYGLSVEQRQIQEVMINPNLAAGNSHLDMGDYKAAEAEFLEALENAGNNPFMKAEAMGALVALYERQNDHEKLLKAFDQYMAYMAALPPGFGGDMRPFMTNMSDSMLLMRARVTPSQINQHAQELPSSDEVSLQSALSRPDELLKMIPIRFD